MTVFVQPAAPRPPPVLAFPGQSLAALETGLDPYAPRQQGQIAKSPDVELNLYTAHDSTLLLGNGLDGVIVLPDGRAIEEPSCFSTLPDTGWQRDIGDIAVADRVFDDLFVGFDAAWNNYFHWLFFALAKSAMAVPLLPAGCRIVLPDEASRRGLIPIAFSTATYRQSVAMFGTAATGSALAWEKDWLTRLPPGRYRARRIHFLWSHPRQPTDLLYLDAFHAAFATLRARLPVNDASPKRLLLLRDKAHGARLSEPEQQHLIALAQHHGFTPMLFEGMDFRQQAETLRNAECIISPHGAGLANIMFGTDSLRILELNRSLKDQPYLRGCFYQLAAQRRQRYVFLDATDGLTPAAMEQALSALLA